MDYSVATGRTIAATPDPLVAELGPGVEADVPFPENPPLVLRPRGGELAESIEAASQWFAQRADVIDWLLVRHGALLLRDFPVTDTDAFARLISHYRPHAAGYVGGATPREAIKGTVYEATQVPPGVTILLHQEMAYLKDYPVKLAFFCNSPPSTGGDTTVGDFRRFMAGLPDCFLRQLEEKGVTYHRSFRVPGVPHPCDGKPLPYHADLRQGFGTTSRRDIEAACERLGMTWEWGPDGSLTTHLSRPAFAAHRLTSERVYFNHVLTQIVDPRWLGEEAYETYLDVYDRAGRTRPYHVTYGDGSEIDMADHELVADGLATVTIAPGWHAGDMLLIDNIYTGHGRTPFTGHRDVQVALID
jgi:alpha-ketoglutarate-dependent taurine dioxygenase